MVRLAGKVGKHMFLLWPDSWVLLLNTCFCNTVRSSCNVVEHRLLLQLGSPVTLIKAFVMVRSSCFLLGNTGFCYVKSLCNVG